MIRYDSINNYGNNNEYSRSYEYNLNTKWRSDAIFNCKIAALVAVSCIFVSINAIKLKACAKCYQHIMIFNTIYIYTWIQNGRRLPFWNARDPWKLQFPTFGYLLIPYDWKYVLNFSTIEWFLKLLRAKPYFKMAAGRHLELQEPAQMQAWYQRFYLSLFFPLSNDISYNMPSPKLPRETPCSQTIYIYIYIYIYI